MSPDELKGKLPELGFDIGMRAIKVDDQMAEQIMRRWNANIRAQVQQAVAGAGAARKSETPPPARGEATLPGVVTVRDFALRLGLPVTSVIAELMKNGILASLNERIDFDTASIVAEDLGFTVTREAGTSEIGEETSDRIRELLREEPASSLVARPPIVVVMGHVDHGKTKLLDAIRKTHVMEGEAGGITQHIGAYQATLPKGGSSRVEPARQAGGRGTPNSSGKITFLDTPGHEAFTAMRSRGAKVADVAVLVVAADEGVRPQTKEALAIIQAAKLPLVVAINKIDKPEADPDKVKRELADLGVMIEGWGGTVPAVPVSAKQNKGIAELLEVILLTAELDRERLMTNPARRAVGTVIESHIDKQEGVLATVLVQIGTLHTKDILAVGTTLYGKVKVMRDWAGTAVSEAAPGMPVRVLGFKVAPRVGDIVEIVDSLEGLTRAKPVQVGSERMATVERTQAPETSAAPAKTVNVIVKADVLGSLEAIVVSFEKFRHAEVAVNVVAKGLGNVTEADVLRAEAASAVVYAFHVQTPLPVSLLGRDKNVLVKMTKTIYEVLDDLKERLEKLLAPEIIVTKLGTVKVLAIFRSEREATIVGGVVVDGKIQNGALLTVLRKDVEVGRGKIDSLQANKQDVAEARMGTECGLKVKSKTKVLVGDLLEAYVEERKERKLG